MINHLYVDTNYVIWKKNIFVPPKFEKVQRSQSLSSHIGVARKNLVSLTLDEGMDEVVHPKIEKKKLYI